MDYDNELKFWDMEAVASLSHQHVAYTPLVFKLLYIKDPDLTQIWPQF